MAAILTKEDRQRTNGRMTRYSRKRGAAPYLFVLPYFVLFLSFSLFPILYSFGISFTNWEGVKKVSNVGLRNFQSLLTDRLFWIAVRNNFIFVAMIIPAQIILAFIIAVILSQKTMPGKKIFRLLVFLPYLTTPIALGVIFGILFDSSSFGVVNSMLMALGLKEVPWTTASGPARVLISLITIWRWTGYTSVIIMAGITNINTDIFEAAAIDGAGFWKTIRYITIPLLKQVMIFVILTSMIGNFQIFEEPYMVFSVVAGKVFGGPDYSALTGMWYFYDTAFVKLKYGYGAAIGVGLFIIIAVVSFAVNKLMQQVGGKD